jgi:RES domain-containing protein
MDPDEVLNGLGTAAIGGRFAPVGTRAVYLSATDSGTGTELLARKARLGGSSQITLDKYPRIVFGVEVQVDRAVDLSTAPTPVGLAELLNRCLTPDAHETSMEVAAVLIAARIQGIVFPSVVGEAENLLVFLENCGPGALTLHNADELVLKAKRMSAKARS